MNEGEYDCIIRSGIIFNLEIIHFLAREGAVQIFGNFSNNNEILRIKHVLIVLNINLLYKKAIRSRISLKLPPKLLATIFVQVGL